MSGHSKWHQIRFKKGIADQKRGKVFTKHARLIESAARQGGEPDMNPGLRMAIDNAKADNLPNDNIDRAIKKGTGELKDTVQMEEVVYEGFGPGKVAFMIEVYTDNRNRANQAVRTLFMKNGGNFGSTGAVSFMFDRKGEIVVASRGDVDEDELEIIDAGAEDVQPTETGFVIYTAPTELGAVRDRLIAKGFNVKEMQLTFVPNVMADIAEPEKGEKVLALLELLEDEDEVTNVCMNANFLYE